MSQRNIGDLPRPPLRHRVDKGPGRFERIRQCRLEDARRIKRLKSAIRRFPALIDVEHASRLTKKLERSGNPKKLPDTLASSLAMGNHRINISGAVWPLMKNGATIFTIIPRKWEFTPEELATVDPKALLIGLRVDLYRKGGAAKAGGWLFMCLHGEFDPTAKIFRLHVHGACSREMIPVLDRLRPMNAYKSVRKLPNGDWSPVFRRVWIRRKPLFNMPDPITYLTQAFWPARPIYINAEGKRRRVRQKRSIREPYHSMVLLWLDRWKIQDLTLLIGLRVTKAGLIETHRSR